MVVYSNVESVHLNVEEAVVQYKGRRVTGTVSYQSYHHIKTWQLTTNADQLHTYKIHAKYNIKHNIATKCEHNVLKTGRSLDVS